MEELTVIIPFLNEKTEVENTLNSLISHTNESINIIVINDASNDGYNYDMLEKKFNITYIKNKERMGVAKCRDLGISKMTTKYFLLLDAHMRFYTNDWYKILLKALYENPKSIICCQSRTIWNICNKLIEYEDRTSNGAYINLNHTSIDFLDVRWDYTKSNNKDLIEIPCILGAGYAGSKEYWTFIRGLEGLLEYGLDEQFLSLKVWLTGGKCLLVKNITIGHIYRNFAPYATNSLWYYYNKMLIIELLLPNSVKYQYYNILKLSNKELFNEAYNRLKTNYDWIEEQKKYFKSIIINEYSYIENFNKSIMSNNIINIERAAKYNELENEIVKLLTISHNNNISISRGICGKIIILLLWARLTKSEIFEKIAESFISIVNENLSYNTPLTFENGLLGVGWCWEFLIQNKLLDGDSQIILEDIDNRIMSIRCDKMKDLSLETGLQGLIVYTLARIKGCIINNNEIPFDKEYICTLYDAIQNLLLNNPVPLKNIYFETELINILENNYKKADIQPLNSNDIRNLIKKNNEDNIHLYHIISEIMKYEKN
ncbi:MAG: glycosyltransferase [Prevotella sp.]|nr:glycosyltransferase [Prevotella sp.]